METQSQPPHSLIISPALKTVELMHRRRGRDPLIRRSAVREHSLDRIGELRQHLAKRFTEVSMTFHDNIERRLIGKLCADLNMARGTLRLSGPTPVAGKRKWLLNRGGLLQCVQRDFPELGTSATQVSDSYLLSCDVWLYALIDRVLAVHPTTGMTLRHEST